jgi:hypothetical protein
LTCSVVAGTVLASLRLNRGDITEPRESIDLFLSSLQMLAAILPNQDHKEVARVMLVGHMCVRVCLCVFVSMLRCVYAFACLCVHAYARSGCFAHIRVVNDFLGPLRTLHC